MEKYSKSVHSLPNGEVYMVRGEEQDFLMAPAGCGFTGKEETIDGKAVVCCELNHENAVTLRKLFPFTAPSAVLTKERTVGVGDRLGLATPGHIRVFEKYDTYPVFAQQSIRELTLTGRTYDDVLDTVTFNVFREDFQKPWGADGDHVKKAEEVAYALSSGYTMITLDCSEHIRNDITPMSDDEVAAIYQADPALEEKYMDKTFDVNGLKITYPEKYFKRMCLIYNEAIDFATGIYNQFMKDNANIDFEVSIDETATTTDPEQHFYVANELISRGVKVATVAPRFCGEFQKGIDYKGDIAQFTKEFHEHALIADYFGYKISVHSGSDKFSVFEIVGRETKGHFHLKTAGTNWLEAMAVIAEHDPGLYREIHQYALDTAFDDARRFYHVTTDVNNIPALDTLADADLITLFGNEDARQLIHITYGHILNLKNEDGSFKFRDRLYAAWRKYDEEYAARLEKHIGHHLETLYKGFR